MKKKEVLNENDRWVKTTHVDRHGREEYVYTREGESDDG